MKSPIPVAHRIDLSEVARQCGSFTQKSGVNVTVPAQQLIARILNSVYSDPHPSWKEQDPATLEKMAVDYLPRVPEILDFVLEREPTLEVITTFDVLTHFRALCDVFCFK